MSPEQKSLNALKEMHVKLDAERDRILKTLVDIGVSQASATKIADSNRMLASCFAGLLALGYDIRTASTVKDMAFKGFVIANQDVEKELIDLLDDPEKYKQAMEVLIRSSLESVLQSAAAGEKDKPTAEVKSDVKDEGPIIVHSGPSTLQ
jgi:hypothetical protein